MKRHLPVLCLGALALGLASCGPDPLTPPGYREPSGYWTISMKESVFSLPSEGNDFFPFASAFRTQIEGKDLHASPISEVPDGTSRIAWPSYFNGKERVKNAAYWWEGATLLPDLNWELRYYGVNFGISSILRADYPSLNAFLIFHFFYLDSTDPTDFKMLFYMADKSIFDSSSSSKFKDLYDFVDSVQEPPIANITYGPPNAASEDTSSNGFAEFAIP